MQELLCWRSQGLVCWQFGPQFDNSFVLQAMLELGAGFGATCMAHPDTYLDKVVIGGATGQLQLWNFTTARKLYDFKLADSAVSHIASSPALDVIAVGLADG